jgi:hypothetical protein
VKGWNYSDIEGLAKKGMVSKKDLPKKPEPAGLSDIKSFLLSQGIRYEEEYKFDKKRKFRFDIFLIDHNIAVEYEGINSEQSRHTNIIGYSKDCEKYNLAVINKIYVLRYTAFNYENFKTDIKILTNE